MPNTDTLAANHGQNRSRGFAVRSDSPMISMPAVSISPPPAVAVVATGAPGGIAPLRGPSGPVPG